MTGQRTQAKERSILASSKPAIRRGNQSNLGREKLLSSEIGVVAIASHIGVAHVPMIPIDAVNLEKLTADRISLVFVVEDV